MEKSVNVNGGGLTDQLSGMFLRLLEPLMTPSLL